jgi:septal ring factor EnvC (AmiA/AmiB activator)
MGFASARKANLTAEIARLEKELSELSNNLSESQVGYKRARIQRLKQELADVDKNKFKDASDKLKQDMNQQDMMAAMAASNGRID